MDNLEITEQIGRFSQYGAGAALEQARVEELTVVPLCPYSRQWMQRHPDTLAGVTVDWGATSTHDADQDLNR